MYYPGQKKRTILEIRGEKNAVPRVISCSIRRDQRRAKLADSRGSDLPALIAPDRAWYHTWNSVLLAANLEDGSFFVQGSTSLHTEFDMLCFQQDNEFHLPMLSLPTPTPPPPPLSLSPSLSPPPLSLSLSRFSFFPAFSAISFSWSSSNGRSSTRHTMPTWAG